MKLTILGTSVALLCSFAATMHAAPPPAPAAPPATSAVAPTPAGPVGLSLTGTLARKTGRFYLMGPEISKPVEVQGADFRKWLGKKVKVAGAVTQGTLVNPEILVVREISRDAVAGAMTGTAAAGVKTGMSTGAMMGLAGGATAATVGTLYATDVIGGDETPASPR